MAELVIRQYGPASAPHCVLAPNKNSEMMIILIDQCFSTVLVGFQFTCVNCIGKPIPLYRQQYGKYDGLALKPNSTSMSVPSDNGAH